MRAKAEVLRVVRAVLSLSLMQPRPRLPTLSVEDIVSYAPVAADIVSYTPAPG